MVAFTIPASSSDGWSESDGNAKNVLYSNETESAYYTWCVATAGKGRYCTEATTSVNDSDYSICPRGWRLPTITQYDALKATGTIIVDTISGDDFDGWNIGGTLFPSAGYVLGGSLGSCGIEGYYWSSTVNGSDEAYDLDFTSNYVITNWQYRYFGFSIRCIAP